MGKTAEEQALEILDAEEVQDEPGSDLALREHDGEILDLVTRDDDWADVDDGDLSPREARIPHLKVSRNVGDGFIDSETGEKSTELTFVWLAKGASRAWFKDPFGQGDSAPACRSFDGKVADPMSPALLEGFDAGKYDGPLPTGDCSTCPLAVWENGEKPLCGSSVEALVFVPDRLGVGNLARIRWSGLAVKPALAYWDSFASRVPRRPPLSVLSKVTLVPEGTNFGEKLVPHFERVSPIDRAAAQPLIDERDRAMGDWKADIADAVVDAKAEDIVEPPPAAGPFDGPADEEPF